jgi:hypothetical protein
VNLGHSLRLFSGFGSTKLTVSDQNGSLWSTFFLHSKKTLGLDTWHNQNHDWIWDQTSKQTNPKTMARSVLGK